MAKTVLTDELLDAFLEGRTSLEETLAIVQMAKQDEELARLIGLYDDVDRKFNPDFTSKSDVARKGKQTLDGISPLCSIPYSAMAADTDCNDCVLACEQLVLQKRGVDFDEQEMRAEALRHRWLRKEGTPLYHIGKLLEMAGLEVHRRFECSIDMLVDELNAGHDVIVAVDGNELIGNYPSEKIKDVEMGETANHAVIVQHVDMVKDIVTVHDPQSTNDTDQYPLDQFVDAWEDSRRFMVSVG